MPIPAKSSLLLALSVLASFWMLPAAAAVKAGAVEHAPLSSETIQWAPPETVRHSAIDSDNWPMTWGDDDAQYTAYGDGTGFKPKVPKKLSMGLAKITGDAESFKGVNLLAPSVETHGDGSKGKKASGILMVDGVLYLLTRNAGNAQMAWSADHGKSWKWADWKFTTSFGCPTFVNFGRNYAGAPDDNVYVFSPDTDDAYKTADRMVLARVSQRRIQEKEAWEYFEKVMPSGTAVWTRDAARRGSLHDWPGRCYRSAVTWSPHRLKFLWVMTVPPVGGGAPEGLTVMESEKLWGPWSILYESQSFDMPPGDSACIPAKWISEDGRTFWLVSSSGDSFCLRKGTILPR